MNQSIIYSIALTLFASGLSYGILQSKIYAITKSIERMKATQTNTATELNSFSVELATTKTNLVRSLEDVKTLERKLDKVLDTLYELNVNVGILINKQP